MTDRPHDLSRADRAALEARLAADARRLRGEIAARLRTQDDPDLVGLANRMEETDDWAAADTMAEQDIALVSRELSELRQVEGALARLEDGSYGRCVGCDAAIPLARLIAYPAATRCIDCQSAAERHARRQA